MFFKYLVRFITLLGWHLDNSLQIDDSVLECRVFIVALLYIYCFCCVLKTSHFGKQEINNAFCTCSWKSSTELPKNYTELPVYKVVDQCT